MIEKTILDYLNEELTVSAFAEYPEDAPGSFVLIERTSGSERNHLKSATVAIQSYASTMLLAAQLNEEVKEVMMTITILPSISSCRLNADYNFTDTTKKRYRYQAVFDLVHYE